MGEVLKQIAEGGDLYSAITDNWNDLSDWDKNMVFLFFRQATHQEVGSTKYKSICNNTARGFVDYTLEEAFKGDKTEYEDKLLEELEQTEERNKSDYSESDMSEDELVRRNTKAKAEVLLKTRWL